MKSNFNKIKAAVVGVLIFMLAVTGIVLAKDGVEWIKAEYADIKIYVKGEELEPKDVNGNPVEPFIHNGTTYVPVRAIGEALGERVGWDDSQKNVHIGSKTNNNQQQMPDIITGFRNLTAQDATELATLNEIVKAYEKASWGETHGESSVSQDIMSSKGIISASILESTQSDKNLMLITYLYGVEGPEEQRMCAMLVGSNNGRYYIADRLILDDKNVPAMYGIYRNTNIGLTSRDGRIYLYYEDRLTGTQGIGVDYKIYDLTSGIFDRKLYLEDEGGTGVTHSTVYKIEDESIDDSLHETLNITDDRASYKEALDNEFGAFGLSSLLNDESLYDYKPTLNTADTHKMTHIFLGNEADPYTRDYSEELIDYTGLEELLK